jgi:imidazole glycerol-phosphate synthase subunit HisH
MGWSEVQASKSSVLLDGMHDIPRFYFVHSYHSELKDPSNELFSAEYGYRFTAALQQENIYGVQFHPEKSHKFGMKLLGNFSQVK